MESNENSPELNNDDSAPSVIRWGDNAPRGGRIVMNRMLREGTKVPLFLGQTFLGSLRDVGYNNTVSAICEHVDNAIEWGAKSIRVYFNETGRRGQQRLDVIVLDDGQGMAPHVLQVAMSFGGSMVYQHRQGIGRFGVGMKTASLSMGSRLEVFSWQERGAIYSMELDVEEISSSSRNLIELSEPQFRDRFPGEIASILTRYMAYPKNPELSQQLVSEDETSVLEALPPNGTLVYLPDCDRLSFRTAKALVDQATIEMARVYRHFLSQGVRIFVNNRPVEPFDPTYWMAGARHTKVEGITETRSRLVNSWPEIQIPVEEGGSVTAPVSVRLYALPIEDWYSLPLAAKKKLQILEDHQVSIMRNHREVFIGVVPKLSGKRHGDAAWLRIQVDFDGRLDEAFGVAMTKQGVRPKQYVLDAISAQISDDVSRVRKKTAEYRANHRKSLNQGQLSEAEQRATNVEALLGKPLHAPAPDTDEEAKVLEENLRSLAVTLKRADETDEQAFQRIRASKYVTHLKHDQHWPFYAVDYQLGRIILTINTAHPFYSQLYQPLSEAAPNSDDEELGPIVANEGNGKLLVPLQLMLLSLARAQSQMLQGDATGEHALLFQTLQREWSDNLRTQLLTS